MYVLDVKIKHDIPDLFVYDKKNREITLIEVGITNLDLLTQVKNKKLRKYDLIANELAMMYKCRVNLRYDMGWNSNEVSQKVFSRYRHTTKNRSIYLIIGVTKDLRKLVF